MLFWFVLNSVSEYCASILFLMQIKRLLLHQHFSSTWLLPCMVQESWCFSPIFSHYFRFSNSKNFTQLKDYDIEDNVCITNKAFNKIFANFNYLIFLLLAKIGDRRSTQGRLAQKKKWTADVALIPIIRIMIHV